MLAIGVDIVAISRMQETLQRSERCFIDRVFTLKEQENSLHHYDAAVYYAEIFAVKEAVFKTFCTEWKGDMSFLDIEILKGSCGEPTVNLKGAFLQLLLQKNAEEIVATLSWEQDSVVAFAVMH